MRILLDAKDLINVVEHSKPISVVELDAWLRARSSRLVYSLSNIRGLAGPIGLDASQLPRIQTYLDQLDYLPHCYVSTDVDLLELRSALHCFEASKEYEPIDPYVPRFDFVFPAFASPARIIYPFRDIVRDLWKACPNVFEPQPKFHKIQTVAMSMDRQKPTTRRAPAESPSEPAIEILMFKMSVTRERATEVASWIGAEPSRCPALWLVRAFGSAMSTNRTYSARKDDTFDMGEMFYFPYVDAATVDRATLDFFTRAIRSLKRRGDFANQTPKVFRSLQDLIATT